MSTKLYRSKSAAIRHAINALGADWEGEAFIHEAPLPGGEFIYSLHPIAPEPKAASRASKPAEPKASPLHRRSSIDRPTKRAYAIADRMKGKPRREIIAACVKAGIASGTAATQYQKWRSEHKG